MLLVWYLGLFPMVFCYVFGNSYYVCFLWFLRLGTFSEVMRSRSKCKVISHGFLGTFYYE